MKKDRWEIVVVALLCTVLGLVCGAMAFGAKSHSVDDAVDAANAAPAILSAATLANLGVTVESLQTSSFTRTIAVAATVVDTQRTELPVFAPVGGRVESIDVERGTVVAPGSTVVTLVRDPLPRPVLTLTADVLRPAQESLHGSLQVLRESSEDLRIATAELERIEKFTGAVGGSELPLIPRQRAIDLQYQVSRAEKNYEHARLELKKHGFADAQITAIEAGGKVPEFNEETWQRALSRNGLWPKAAQDLSAVLPQSLRALPWVTATIGELAASGLATAEFTEWVSAPDVGVHFLDLGVLLQRGHTLPDLKRLHALNALDPVVRVQAPVLETRAGEETAAAWDVASLEIKRGARVSAGDQLVVLRDPRQLQLRSEPVGGEVAAVLAAARSAGSVAAKPLIAGAGPELQNLSISYVTSGHARTGTVAFVDVANAITNDSATGEGGKPSRTWGVREGMRYLLLVPTQQLENVFVLPASAVTESGPDRIVFLQDGDAFKPVPIIVAFEDNEVVVIPRSKEVELFPGDAVVSTGAFELGLAMNSGDAVDPHAGHSH